MESIGGLLSMQKNVIPPTINYETADPDCDLDYVANEKRDKELATILCNSYGFGGNNASVVYSKVLN